jgi:hypothetical protein
MKDCRGRQANKSSCSQVVEILLMMGCIIASIIGTYICRIILIR